MLWYRPGQYWFHWSFSRIFGMNWKLMQNYIKNQKNPGQYWFSKFLANFYHNDAKKSRFYVFTYIMVKSGILTSMLSWQRQYWIWIPCDNFDFSKINIVTYCLDIKVNMPSLPLQYYTTIVQFNYDYIIFKALVSDAQLSGAQSARSLCSKPDRWALSSSAP